MSRDIQFEIEFDYNTLERGIVLPAVLMFGEESSNVRAKLDTGAAFCVFERKHGERLGLDVESGMPLRMATATGNFDTFGHRINLSVLGIENESTVYFAAEDSFYLNVLGRQGWLDRVKLGLIDYEGKLLLSIYDK